MTYTYIRTQSAVAMDHYHKFENYDSSRLTPRKIRRDAYRPSLLKRLCAGDIFTRYIRTRGINNSQVDYWIQDSEMRVCFIAGWIRDDITGQDWNSTLKEYRGRKEVWSFQQLSFFREVWDEFEAKFYRIIVLRRSFCLDGQEKKKKKVEISRIREMKLWRNHCQPVWYSCWFHRRWCSTIRSNSSSKWNYARHWNPREESEWNDSWL